MKNVQKEIKVIFKYEQRLLISTGSKFISYILYLLFYCFFFVIALELEQILCYFVLVGLLT